MKDYINIKIHEFFIIKIKKELIKDFPFLIELLR